MGLPLLIDVQVQVSWLMRCHALTWPSLQRASEYRYRVLGEPISCPFQ